MRFELFPITGRNMPLQDDIRDIRTTEDFAKLPPLTRAEVNAHRKELCPEVPNGKLIAHATGGSSGVPTR